MCVLWCSCTTLYHYVLPFVSTNELVHPRHFLSYSPPVGMVVGTGLEPVAVA